MNTIIEKVKVNLPLFRQGEVWLVGAGPGDPGLLTLHALCAIRQADHILHDALVDDACLALAHADAVIEFAGKRAGKPSLSQHEITTRLIELAKINKKVLRLKGGDPFVFGRGGEEALALALAEVPFRIVPGITAGIAAPAAFGIPVTSRQINQSVTFITGHDAVGGVPDLDWSAIARASNVLVIYMALKHIDVICQKLLAAGRKGDEPLAFIANATTKLQSLTITTLAEAGQTVWDKKIATPAIIIVGKAVELAGKIIPLSLQPED